MTVTVRACVRGDLESVLSMNNGAVPAVNSLALEDLDHLWSQSAHLVVAEVEGAVGGFLLLLDGPGRDYDSPNYAWFSDRYDSFVYVDRIVVDARNRGQGIGRKLYEWAIARESSSYPVLCAEVNIRPRNQSSLDFHRAMRFAEVGRQDTENGAKSVVMLALELA